MDVLSEVIASTSFYFLKNIWLPKARAPGPAKIKKKKTKEKVKANSPLLSIGKKNWPPALWIKK
jgi:hypothetical protein